MVFNNGHNFLEDKKLGKFSLDAQNTKFFIFRFI